MVQRQDGRSDEGSSDSKRARPIKIKVEQVAVQGQSAVFQYAHGKQARRVLVPKSVVDENGMALLEDLEAGIPQSIDWGSKFQLKASSDEVTAALQGVGIWTIADAYAKQEQFQRSVSRMFVRSALETLGKMKQEEKHGTR